MSIPTSATNTVTMQLSAIVSPCAVQVRSDSMEVKLIRVRKTADNLLQAPVLDNLISERHPLRLDIPAGLAEMFDHMTPCCKFKDFVKGMEYCEIIANTQSF